jgi:formate/nitrite transporter FocA (FNT family)
VIAVGALLIGAVLLITGGVVADSTDDETLTFYGIWIHTSAAQVFLTGAICTWLLLAGMWLLRFGMRRSRDRRVQYLSSRATEEHDQP